jgi:hypothetical protein
MRGIFYMLGLYAMILLLEGVPTRLLKSHLKSGNRSTRDGTEVLRRRLKLLRLWDLGPLSVKPVIPSQ